MRYYPETEYDWQDYESLNAQKWMLDCLKMNPSYISWGPYEDYMIDEKTQWASRIIFETWEDFGPWELNELNEIVNFYFEIGRDSKTCETCNGTGLNPESAEISRSFYDFERTGKRWCGNITQDEFEVLKENHRIPEIKTVEQANENDGRCHDAINRWILIEARAKRLGVWGDCSECDGGSIYTEPHGKLGLILWVLHPRKGCSRGLHIKHITHNQLPTVIEFLREAAKRNAERFAKLTV